MGDWKRHKLECKVVAKKAEDEEAQNKSKNCLQVGQSQHVLTTVRFLHHYAVISKEMMEETDTEEVEIVEYMVKPKFHGLELGTMQLGIREVGLICNAIWSMEKKDRNKMIRKFITKMKDLNCPNPEPDFAAVADWGLHGVSGNFAVVKHSEKGTILLHEDPEKNTINGYLGVGLTQSIESLLAAIPKPLPLYVNTALFPFKKVLLCQGTIMPARGYVNDKLQAAAQAFVDGQVGDIEIIERIST